MDCFNQQLRRTAPINSGGSRNELVPSKPARMNGWSWPPQVAQIIGWLVFIYMAIISFGIYIPLLPPPWNHIVYALTGTAFIVHFLSHLAAEIIDPADASVRAKQTYSNPMPLFDRTKQPHVIQDLHCYLCDVKVGPKVKHCSLCNKCVQNFDHHCKWLNNCVGGRNYWCFFVALCSATFGTLMVLIVILFIFIQHYLDPNNLRTAPQFNSTDLLANETWLVFLPAAPIKTTSVSLLVVAFITVLLSVISLLLLGHLLGTHLYLLYKGISTYDYIKIQRQKEARNKDLEVENDTKHHNKAAKSQTHSIDCEPTLAPSSSVCDKVSFSSRLSLSVCTELEHFKNQTEKDSSLHYGTNITSKGVLSESSSKDRRKGPDVSECLSSNSVPQMQDPLGSSVMIPDETGVEPQCG